MLLCATQIDLDTVLPSYEMNYFSKFYTSYTCHVPDDVEHKGCRKLHTTLRSEFREVSFKT